MFDIVVDAYSETERALSWYYYLQDKVSFPFHARCTDEKSPFFQSDQSVQVVGLAEEDACMVQIMVVADVGGGRGLIPLAQCFCTSADRSTIEAIGDWQYWLGRGYQF